MSDTENALVLAGRVLMAVIFIIGGWSNIVGMAAVQGMYAHKFGLPMPEIAWVIATIVEMGGGLALLFGLFTRPVAAVLAVWCILTALIAHSDLADPGQKCKFLKNIAMTGGFLYVIAFGARAWSIDAWRAGKRGLAITA